MDKLNIKRFSVDEELIKHECYSSSESKLYESSNTISFENAQLKRQNKEFQTTMSLVVSYAKKFNW